MTLQIDPTTTKYLIRATISADGVVEKPDVVGAIFGQTEGLLGNEMDLRDLQKSGRIGRIEVDIESKKGKSTGDVILPSSMDQVETAIIAAALESIDRVGPCKAEIKVKGVEDVRVTKRQQVIERARELLQGIHEGTGEKANDITELVRDELRVEEIVSFGPDRLPAGPNVTKSDAILVVEGRNDVINLLKHGIKNAIAVEGTSISKAIQDLTKEKVATAFVDGDRGGELILKELLQTAEIDFIARAPRGREVEELSQKQIMKSLRAKIPAEQFVEMYGIGKGESENRRSRGRGDREERGGRGGRERGGRDRGDREPSEDREERRERGGRDREPSEDREERRERGRGRDRGERRERGGRDRGDREDRGRGRDREERRERQPVSDEFVAEPVKAEGGERGDRETKFVSLLDELGGKLQARLLGKDLEPVGDAIAVRDLADTLKKAESGDVQVVVFDGVVTQRLLDIASDRKIDTLVGVKTGNITKKPANVEILTRAELS